ncbi:alkene reductase [Simplicispira psychrophila]|uniref:alkene reductase n=1 Tax=Simplicispira psychrophila TaxID=80882 RepID=UPI000486853B|nr:alkene reductase [Simplicispira psychrophila]
MTTLFDPIQAGRLHLSNRIAMAPLTRNRAPDAIPTPLMAQYYAQRASAGLLITEATAISPQAQGYSDVPGLYSTEQLDGWKKVTHAVHAADGQIVVQLWHVGRVSHTSLQPEHQAPVAPSALRAHTKTVLIQDGVPTFVDTSMPRALDAAELPGIVQDYRHAARNAIACGFDGVEIHAANGYLLEQFLKTGANQRTDDYGGNLKNRTRLLLEVVRAITDEIGPDRTAIRLSPVTPANDITDDHPQQIFDYLMHQLAPLGLAYLHIVEGATGGARELPDQPFDYAQLKAVYRTAGGQGAWMVNNAYDKAMAEQALAAGADIVAFGRPYIANPDLVERLQRNAPLNTPDRATFYGGGAEGYTDYPTLDA